MAAIPARIAGVKEIVMTSPVGRAGLNPVIVAAAQIAGVDRIFKVGGAQAVAAMAYGTESVPAVDKIVGPGNAWVATAKKLVFGRTGIDMIAGPSEILVIADETADPAVAAADLLSQAEHDELASSILLTPDEELAKRVSAEVKAQLKRLSRESIAVKAIRDYGLVVVTQDLAEAVEVANRFAPEHLELLVKDPKALLAGIRNAGAVFLGHYTPEALGDYLAGPNHILPTGGTARFSSPLGVYDFVKRISVLSFDAKALEKYGKPAAEFAAMEGLDAHGKSILARLKAKKS
jgi:histidinol dehydrogenase